jgi:hypothetical protein
MINLQKLGKGPEGKINLAQIISDNPNRYLITIDSIK